jgi:hypothetical protein
VRQQIQGQAIRSETAVRTGVDVAPKATEVWRTKAGDLTNMNSLKSLPPTDSLILPYTLVESLALIDIQKAIKLSAALDEMRLARDVIESTRNVDNKGGRTYDISGAPGKKQSSISTLLLACSRNCFLFLGTDQG